MILGQTTSITISLISIVVVTTILFTIKFIVLRKKFLEMFFKLPSVIVVGPENSGKLTMIKNITGNKTVANPFENNINVGYINDGDNKIQMISLPYHSLINFVSSGEIKKLNNKIFLSVFDVSSNSDDIETQITDFERNLPYFKGFNKLIVANKVDIADEKKIKKLNKKFGEVHKVSSFTKEGLEELENNIRMIIR